MPASTETAAFSRLREALEARELSRKATTRERETMVRFMREAIHNGWTWNRIGALLGESGTAARRYYDRNHRNVTVR